MRAVALLLVLLPLAARAQQAPPPARPTLVVFNFTPMPQSNYRIGVQTHGMYQELLNTAYAETDFPNRRERELVREARTLAYRWERGEGR